MRDNKNKKDEGPPFSYRTTVILLVALYAGTAIGALTYMGGIVAPLSIVAGLTAFGAVVAAHRLFGGDK